jgi:hypothetical protein
MPEPGARLFQRSNAWSSVQGDLLPPSPPAEQATARQSGKAGAGIGERRYGADLGPANMFNRQFGGRPSIAFTRHM